MSGPSTSAIAPQSSSPPAASSTNQSDQHGRGRLKNRMLMCALAVCLMWATSLRVAVIVVSFFIEVPPLESVVDSFKSAYQVTLDEKDRFAQCADVQIQQCDDELLEASYKEIKRVNVTTALNQDIVDAARKVQNDCSSAYTSLRYAIEAWVDAGHFLPYMDNSTCSAEDLSRLTSSVGDISEVRSEALSVSLGYSADSQSTVRRLAEYAELRAAYDAEYINNHTLKVQGELMAFAGEIEMPALNVDKVFEDIQVDVDSLISCVSPRSVDAGECPTFRGAQERLDDIRTEMERRLEIYEEMIIEWRQKTDEYISNVQAAYDSSVRFYWGVKNAIPEWFADIAFNTDWGKITAADMTPIDVTFPLTPPSFSDLPPFEDVFDSVKVSFDLFKRQLDSAKATVVQLAEELGDAVERNLVLNLPDVTPSDYNPPKYNGTDGKSSSVSDEPAIHSGKSEGFIRVVAVLLDKFSDLSRHGSDEDSLQNNTSSFSYSNFQNKLSNVDVSFMSLIGPDFDFDFWFLALKSFGDALFLFDLFYRIYSTLRVIYKYWDAGAVKLPKVDMRSRKKSNTNNALRTPTLRLLLMILFNPAMIFFLVSMTMWWLVTSAVSVYTPLYQGYLTGCVPLTGNGTFITGNLLTISHNHASQDGSSKLVEGLKNFDAERGKSCSSRHAPSASRYQNDVSALSSLSDAHALMSNRMGLMQRCVDADALDTAFQKTCCDHEGYSSCSVAGDHKAEGDGDSNFDGGTCPMNDLLQPPSPLLSPIEHFIHPSCDVNLANDSSWKIEDSVFHCDALPSCDITCKGPNRPKLEQATRECGCMAEWFLHSIWLKVVLSLLVFALTNASRIGLVDGLARIWWHSLHPDEFTVTTSCERDGTIIIKRIKRKGMQSDDDVQAYIKGEIDRNMVRFQAKGLGMVACAILANVMWIYVLGNISSSSTPTWLVSE